jgi:hypothetical protein
MVQPQESTDEDIALTCIDCGASIEPEVDRSFACGPDVYLCFTCAEGRGGIYDEGEDRWVRAPDVAELPDERRAHP